MTRLNTPIAVPRFSGAKLVIITFISSGIKIADPDACSMRPKIKTVKVGDKPATAVPARNRSMEVRNNLRALNFYIKKAVVGTTIPETSIYAVVTHWTVEVVTPNSSLIDGSATFKKVLDKKATKAPESRMIISL